MQVPDASLRRRGVALAIAALVVLGAIAYAPLARNAFVAWDDDTLILQNPIVTAPLGLETLRRAFSLHGAGTYWHPATMLSFALDRALFGLDPVAFHLESLAWHLAAALVLLALLHEATGALGRSWIVAALFALHPVNVESVAWAVERRNVLAAFFGLVAVWAHVRAARRGRRGWHVLLLVATAASLASKALLLPLPALLLALDAWPLRRFGRVPLRRLLLEKVPVAALCLAAAAVVSASLLPVTGVPPPLGLRLANAAVAVPRHLAHLVFPVGLSPFYEYPSSVPPWQVAASLALVAALSAGAWRLRERAPFLLAGWLWFLASLVPTLGLRQAGTWPALADRHAYLAAIGVFIAVTWAAAEVLPQPRGAAAALAGALALLVPLTFLQVRIWRDSLSVFERAVTTAPGSAHIRYNLGTTLAEEHPARLAEGIEHLAAAVRIEPGNARARTNLGIALASAGRLDEAVAELGTAARLAPESAQAHAALGNALLDAHRHAEAAAMLERAVALEPGNPRPHANLAAALNGLGRFEETIARFEEAPPAARALPQARFNVAVAYAATGRPEAALREAAALRREAPELAASLEQYVAELSRR